MTNARGAYFDEESKKNVILQHEKNKCAQAYPIKHIIDNIEPFLTYCEFKDISTAKQKLFKGQTLERSNTKAIDSKVQTDETNDIFLSLLTTSVTTLSSWAGLKTNQAKAEHALKLMILACAFSKRYEEKEAYYVIHALLNLAKIYNSLPPRSTLNPANGLSYLFKSVAPEPRVRAAIKGIFKAYGIMPKVEATIDEKALDKEVSRLKDLYNNEKVDITPSATLKL